MACSGNDESLGILNSPQRNNYFYGKLMDVPHFEMEQRYANRKRWLLNRLGLGYGVLCGLRLTIKDTKICVSPGVAIDAYGREIIVPQEVFVDPWALTDECGSPKSTPLSNTEAHDKILLCAAYKECRTDFMPVLVTDCNTKQDCLPGTIVESYCVLVQDAGTGTVLPPNFPPTIDPALCAELGSGASEEDKRQKVCELNPAATCGMLAGPVCVVLGTVSLKADGTIDDTKLDQCSLRTNLVSNEHLLDMLLCTGGSGGTVTPPDLTKINAISWTHDQTIRIQNFPPTLTVTFSNAVSTTATKGRAWFIVTLELPGGGGASVIGARTTGGSPTASANPLLLSTFVVNGVATLATPTATFRPTADFLIAVQALQDPDPNTHNVQTLPLLCRVTVLCDFVLDQRNSKAVDGDFLGGVLPTGDGVPGGVFESWFFVTMQIDLGPKT